MQIIHLLGKRERNTTQLTSTQRFVSFLESLSVIKHLSGNKVVMLSTIPAFRPPLAFFTVTIDKELYLSKTNHQETSSKRENGFTLNS